MASGGIDAYTKLMLHCDGADESQTFTDSSFIPHTVTAGGTAQIDTAEKKFGSGSALLDGNSDYLSVADSADWNFGTGDFTIDFWVRFAVDPSGSNVGFYSQYTNANNVIMWYYHDSGSLFFYVRIGGVVKVNNSVAWNPAADTWYHLELARNTTTLYMFIDGTSQSLTETTAISTNDLGDLAEPILFGYPTYYGTGYLNGWMEEIRVSKGIARHTENFDVPTEAYYTHRETVEGTLTFTGIAKKLIYQTIAGILTFIGIARKLISRTIAGVLTFAVNEILRPNADGDTIGQLILVLEQ